MPALTNKTHTSGSRLAEYGERMSELLIRRRAELEARAARIEAELAIKARSEFLANMNHELRTPLNAIIGLSEALELGVFGPIEDERHLRYLGDIRQSGHHLLALISDILDLAKVEAGALDINYEVFALSELIEECLHMMQTISERQGVALRLDGPVVPVQVSADRRKILQALINILSNAVKYSPGGGTVSLSALLDEDGLHLSVRDQGIGIEESQITRIFQPFGRLNQALSSAVEGAGLGLPIAQRFIDLHGGTIRVSSRVGAGTRVTIDLPLNLVRSD